MSTTIHATVDALGNPTAFHLTGGQAAEVDGADVLLPQIVAPIVIADKGYDADTRVVDRLAAAGKTAVIPPMRHRRVLRTYDRHLYRERHRIEQFFGKLTQFRAIATRYDTTKRHFLAAIHLAASVILLN